MSIAIPLRRNPRRLARRAGLRHVTDEEQGIRRVKKGRGFVYLGVSGRSLRELKTLKRIEALVIPPAWAEVWICRDARGHIQATGRDEKGRKQFLYHAQWQEESSRVKHDHLLHFGQALPRIRKQVEADLQLKPLVREKTLALAIRLLDLTGIRVGNREYVQSNGSHGLTTLECRHVKFKGGGAEFSFPGKSGKDHRIEVSDKRILPALKATYESDSDALFTYEDEAGVHDIDARELNQYLKEVSRIDATAKDFRTWLASCHAAAELFERQEEMSPTKRKRVVAEVVRHVAERLGNTPAVCRKSYIDPRLLAAFENDEFPKLFASFRSSRRRWLRHEDQLLLYALERLSSRNSSSANSS